MAVYVDRLILYGKSGSWPGGEACHLIADTEEELHAMAERIGLKRQWFQGPPGHEVPHYDLMPGRRAAALREGAEDAEDCRDEYLDCIRWWRLKAAKRERDSRNGRA